MEQQRPSQLNEGGQDNNDSLLEQYKRAKISQGLDKRIIDLNEPVNTKKKQEDEDEDYMSAEDCIEEGKNTFWVMAILALVVLAINLGVLWLFKWKFSALYWLNMGFIVIRPFFNFFKGINVTYGYYRHSYDFEPEDTFEVNQWFWGIIIGVVVLFTGTWVLEWIAKSIFPPQDSYAYIYDAIVIWATLFISGRFILKNAREAIMAAKVYFAGKRELKNPDGPSADSEVEEIVEKHLRGTTIIRIVTVLLCILTVAGQFIQTRIMTPKIEKALDTVSLYRQAEYALPLSDDVLENGVGEFGKYSLTYDMALEEDLIFNGITGHFSQNAVYGYDSDEKCWGVSLTTPILSNPTALNVSGIWSADGCHDQIDDLQNVTYTLKIDKFNLEKASGKFTVKQGDNVIYSTTFEGNVLFDTQDNCFYMQGFLDGKRNEFFGVGWNNLDFKYDIYTGDIVLWGDYTATLKKQK